MIALWNQQATQPGAAASPASSRRCSTTLAQHNPQAFIDITQGTNALFGGSCCPTRPGYDLATGWGSPVANVIASSLVR